VAEVVNSWEMPIRSEDDVILVRRKARALAQERGFDAFAAAALTTAASELGRNTLVHGMGGKAIIEQLSDGRRAGIRLTFVDSGPGIADIDRVLAGGYSTARSLGMGVSGTRRLVEDFAIESAPGQGTKVTIGKWTRY
jgi:serine/threonine-protein kinase RsbT